MTNFGEVFDNTVVLLVTMCLKYSITRIVVLKISFINILKMCGRIYRAKTSSSDLLLFQLITSALQSY